MGNVLTIKDPDLNTTTYTYDGLNRLVTDTNQLNQTRTYGYDAASRITSLGSQFANAAYNDNSTYTYDNTNQLAGVDHSAINDEGYTYDANGDRTCQASAFKFRRGTIERSGLSRERAIVRVDDRIERRY